MADNQILMAKSKVLMGVINVIANVQVFYTHFEEPESIICMTQGFLGNVVQSSWL